MVTLGAECRAAGYPPLEGRTLRSPIAGMMIGNSMTAVVLIARRLVDELRDNATRGGGPNLALRSAP